MPQSRPALATRCEALSQIYTDTILHDARVLKFVVEMIGADRLMLGSDMPFPIGDTEPMKIVAEAGFRKRRPIRSTADWRRGYLEFNDKTKDQRSKAMNKRLEEEVT